MLCGNKWEEIGKKMKREPVKGKRKFGDYMFFSYWKIIKNITKLWRFRYMKKELTVSEYKVIGSNLNGDENFLFIQISNCIIFHSLK